MKAKSGSLYLAILLSISLLSVGCERLKKYPSPTPTNTPIPVSALATQSQKPDIRGKITAVLETEGQINAIHIEGVLENDTKYDRATARITEKTLIYVLKGDSYEVASIDQLVVGLRVEVLFKGMILEKYPVSAEADEILIVP
jgi:hypothetical protein